MLKLYENIKKYRKLKGMSQSELAKRTGYSNRSAISRIENGDIDLPQSKILLFAEALGVDVGELMGDTSYNESINATIDQMDSKQRDRLLAYARFILSDKED